MKCFGSFCSDFTCEICRKIIEPKYQHCFEIYIEREIQKVVDDYLKYIDKYM
ncbi:MAG: hypothetical protein ACRDB0_02060 [Paraclostridium sp.]